MHYDTRISHNSKKPTCFTCIPVKMYVCKLQTQRYINVSLTKNSIIMNISRSDTTTPVVFTLYLGTKNVDNKKSTNFACHQLLKTLQLYSLYIYKTHNREYMKTTFRLMNKWIGFSNCRTNIFKRDAYYPSLRNGSATCYILLTQEIELKWIWSAKRKHQVAHKCECFFSDSIGISKIIRVLYCTFQ